MPICIEEKWIRGIGLLPNAIVGKYSEQIYKFIGRGENYVEVRLFEKFSNYKAGFRKNIYNNANNCQEKKIENNMRNRDL